MKRNRSAASLNQLLRVVIQFTALLGMWSRKIAQLATPRNRSRRRSRPLDRVGLMFIGNPSRSRTMARWEAGKRPAGTGRARIVTRLECGYIGCRAVQGTSPSESMNEFKNKLV